ncbi:hypothetical protein BRC2024_HCTLARHO_CDS_0046 [Acinetobacter phage vB_AbaS_Silvergun]
MNIVELPTAFHSVVQRLDFALDHVLTRRQGKDRRLGVESARLFSGAATLRNQRQFGETFALRNAQAHSDQG